MTDKKKEALITERQRRALHLYFSLLATELNAAGYSVQLVLKEKMDLDWTPEMVKDLLWRPAQMAIVKKYSTTKLRKAEEITTIYDHLTRHLGTIFGVHVPFPAYKSEEEYLRITTSTE